MTNEPPKVLLITHFINATIILLDRYRFLQLKRVEDTTQGRFKYFRAFEWLQQLCRSMRRCVFD